MVLLFLFRLYIYIGEQLWKIKFYTKKGTVHIYSPDPENEKYFPCTSECETSLNNKRKCTQEATPQIFTSKICRLSRLLSTLVQAHCILIEINIAVSRREYLDDWNWKPQIPGTISRKHSLDALVWAHNQLIIELKCLKSKNTSKYPRIT